MSIVCSKLAELCPRPKPLEKVAASTTIRTLRVTRAMQTNSRSDSSTSPLLLSAGSNCCSMVAAEVVPASALVSRQDPAVSGESWMMGKVVQVELGHISWLLSASIVASNVPSAVNVRMSKEKRLSLRLDCSTTLGQMCISPPGAIWFHKGT